MKRTIKGVQQFSYPVLPGLRSLYLYLVICGRFITYCYWLVFDVDAFLPPRRLAYLSHGKHTNTTTYHASSGVVPGADEFHSQNDSKNVTVTTTTTSTMTTSSETNPDPPRLLSQLHTYHKPRQKRSSTRRPRKPRYYWQSNDNIRSELHQFWDELSVKIPSDLPPPIPSEYLLNYFHRNDLRWGISQMGGRENVAYILGGAKVIPGKWTHAIEFDEVKQLLPRMVDGNATLKNTQEFPTMRQSHGDPNRDDENITRSTSGMNRNSSSKLITLSSSSSDKQTNSTTSKTKEFWSKEKTVKNIYQYLDTYRKHKQRPAVWMPQLAELSREGYSKLFNACSRFKKLPYTHPVLSSTDSSISVKQIERADIHHIAGLVPFREWRYFESQLHLFVELEYYLSLYHNGSEEFFPEPSDILSNGHQQLYDLIRIHGGKTMLAQKLDMKYAWEFDIDAADCSNCGNQSFMVAHQGVLVTRRSRSWGPFSLGFAVKLLNFVRSQYLLLNPPLSCAHISMPSESDLVRGGYKELATQVNIYGGYENVARKLGLQFFDERCQWMDERAFRVAKNLWKNRHDNTILLDNRAMNLTVGEKPKGVPWSEDHVIRELLAYTQVNMTKRSLPYYVMPRFRQLDEDGRDDLRRAISKFGGSKYISEKAQLMSIDKWQNKL